MPGFGWEAPGRCGGSSALDPFSWPRARPMPPAPQRPALSSADWPLLIGLSLLWGGSFFFAKIAVFELPPLTVALGRVAIAATILLTLARTTGVALPRTAVAWKRYALMGLLNNVFPFALLFW